MRYILLILVSSVLLVLAEPRSLHAGAGAQETWVDVDGQCGGNTPCFTTIQQAVRLTGPAPAVIYLFPTGGVPYSGNVDLSQMGADIGSAGGPGYLEIETVNASGEYQRGTATLVPPIGIFSGPDFAGDVQIHGLNIEDAGGTAVSLDLTGNASLHDVTITNSNGFGAQIRGLGVTIRDSLAEENEFGGFDLAASGDVWITDSQANENAGDDEADGFLVVASGDVSTYNIEAHNNAADGIDLEDIRGSADIRFCSASGNGTEGVDIDRADGGLTILSCVATNNEDDGLEIGEEVTVPSPVIRWAKISGHPGDGIDLRSSGEAIIECSDFEGNAVGLDVDAGDTVLAENNWWGDVSGPAHPSNPTGTGDGVEDSSNGGQGVVDFTPFRDSECVSGVPLHWGNTDCGSSLNAFVSMYDTLWLLRYLEALVSSMDIVCPGPNDLVEIDGYSPQIWYDLNCDGVVDARDVLPIIAFTGAVELDLADGCPPVNHAFIGPPAGT